MLTEYLDDLHYGPIRLQFDKIVEFEPGGELAPYYHYQIINKSDEITGHINFRVGDTRHIKLCAGHIGFEVLPEHQGHSYSYFACLAIVPLIQRHYDKVIVTTDPDNMPSRHIIEKLGAEFIDEVEVPTDDPAYAGGSRRKLRFEWIPIK